DGGGGTGDVGQRQTASARRTVRGTGADGDHRAVQGVRPIAAAHLHRDRRTQSRSGAGARRPRVRAGARRGVSSGTGKPAADRSRIPEEDLVAVISTAVIASEAKQSISHKES